MEMSAEFEWIDLLSRVTTARNRHGSFRDRDRLSIEMDLIQFIALQSF